MTASDFQVKGFRASGVQCGLKKDGGPDMALFVSDLPCAVAGVFTTNQIKAAPVIYDQQIVAMGKPVRAVIANAGNANACTGQQGMKNTRVMAEHTAQAVGCEPDEVLVLSTGVIGVQLPMDKVLAGIDLAAECLAVDGWLLAAQAIMTTDTRPKIASRSSSMWSIMGIAKGSGMIAPNMATMLSMITTSAAASPDTLQRLLGGCTEQSFNRIVIDGDMSTNDTVLLLANGADDHQVAGHEDTFLEDLDGVCTDLAMSIVKDGEGATKFIQLNVTGAPDEQSAMLVARAIATSPLCKTAFYGADPNWGRVIAAAGYAGVVLDPDRMSLDLVEPGSNRTIGLVRDGVPQDFDETEAKQVMEQSEWRLDLDLGIGQHGTTVWTCDLSHDYVTINGHYRT